MKQQINFRASDLTRRQIDDLARWWGMNQSEVISVIVDRAYQEQKKVNSQIPPMTDDEIEEELRQLREDKDGDETVEHPDTQFSDYPA